jgi:hypothetical protein
MSSVFVLLLITNLGVQQAAQFDTMKSCLEASDRIKKMESFCVEKKPLDSREIEQFMGIFRRLIREIDSDAKN